MPIVWKVAFEEPLIKQIQSGTIGNNKQLVRAIVTQYDLCIKQGLAGPPGTAAGPFLAGKRFALEKALNTYFKISGAKQKIAVALIYVALLKTIYNKIKEVTREVKETKNKLSRIQAENKQIRSQIKSLSKQKTIESKKRIIQLKSKSNALLQKRTEALSILTNKKEELKNFVKPKINDIRKQLQKLVLRITLPALQDTKLKSFRVLPTRIKNLIKEFKDKKRELQGEIKKNVQTVNDASKTFKTIRTSVNKEQAAIIKSNIKTVMKSTNINASAIASKQIMGILDNIGPDKISVDARNNCRNSLNKIISAKMTIKNKKDEIKSTIQSKIKERKKQLISSFKPNLLKGPSKIKELLDDRKRIKGVVQDIRGVVKQVNESVKVLRVTKKELATITSNINKKQLKYIPNNGVAQIFNQITPNLGDKYKQIKTTKEAKTFMITLLTQYIQENLAIKEKLNKYKKQYLKDYVRFILKKKFNPEELIFNQFLRIGLLGYWAGGVFGIGTIANVLFPGTVTLPVKMTTTANPANFIKSLSRTFQLHLKTVSGIITFPGSPPVVLPWATYN